MRSLFIIAYAILFVTSGYSKTLITPSFVIVIINNEPEGVVSSNNILYVGVSKKSGNTIKIKGRTAHTMEPDGVTPNKFLGYVFEKDNTTYYVRSEGVLMVQSGQKLLVEESGKWVDD